MDAFYHSNTIPVIAQLQNQIDSIDRFLSWVCPDYTRYKGFMEFQQQPFTPLFQTPPQLDITNTNASTFQAGFHLGKDPFTTFNNNSTNTSFTVPPRRVKKKRAPVPPTAMKDIPNSELPLKRRGRKRKCPPENGNDNKENMDPANSVGTMPQTPTNPCGTSVYLPMPGAGSTMNCFKPLQQVNNVPKSCNDFTKLDLLAAVSSLFKGNQRQFSSGSRLFQPPPSSNVTNSQFQQSLQQRAHWAPPPHCCQNHEMYPELQQHHGVLQQNQESNQCLRVLESSPSDSSISGSGSPEVTRNEEEFNIETSIPDQEVIV